MHHARVRIGAHHAKYRAKVLHFFELHKSETVLEDLMCYFYNRIQFSLKKMFRCVGGVGFNVLCTVCLFYTSVLLWANNV